MAQQKVEGAVNRLCFDDVVVIEDECEGGFDSADLVNEDDKDRFDR